MKTLTVLLDGAPVFESSDPADHAAFRADPTAFLLALDGVPIVAPIVPQQNLVGRIPGPAMQARIDAARADFDTATNAPARQAAAAALDAIRESIQRADTVDVFEDTSFQSDPVGAGGEVVSVRWST